MLSLRTLLQSSIITILFLALFVGNAFIWESLLLGSGLVISYLLVFGYQLGRGVASAEHPVFQWGIGAVLLLSLLMLGGSLAYYTSALTPSISIGILLLSTSVSIWFGERAHVSLREKWQHLAAASPHRIPATAWITATFAVIFLFLVFVQLSGSPILEAVRSPWSALPASLFLAFFIASGLIFFLAFRGKERSLAILLSTGLLFLFLSVALFAYPIGFGFDPFIHQATEEHIALHGTIEPKPFYYIGQYSLAVMANQVFHLPITLVDKALVPLHAALFLPLFWYVAAVHLLKNRRLASASLTGLFLLPLSSFIVTTPQGLANLWIFLTALLSVPYLLGNERPRVYWLFIPALATLATHPIAGLPILLFVSLVAVKDLKPLFWLFALLGSMVLPASFVVNSLRTSGRLGIDLGALTPANLFSSVNLSLFFENRFDPLLDFVYLYGLNATLIVLFVAIVSWWMYRKGSGRPLAIFLVMAGALGINYLLMKTAVDFSFLIDYERQNYADRLVPITLFFLSPLLMLGLGGLFSRLVQAPLVLRASALMLLAAIATSALYLTYPRDDAYARSGGFNVSRSDINAVFAVDDWAQEAPHVVLANQSVSAAAIRNLGFKRYYGDLFYYPIPTGDDLYQFFLEMNDRPNRETAEAAMDLANARCNCEDVQTLFYIVNDYWWQAPRIVETAKANADAWIALDKNKIHIFRYDRK